MCVCVCEEVEEEAEAAVRHTCSHSGGGPHKHSATRRGILCSCRLRAIMEEEVTPQQEEERRRWGQAREQEEEVEEVFLHCHRTHRHICIRRMMPRA